MKNSYARPTVTPVRRDTFLAEELEVFHKLNNQLSIILADCSLLAQDKSDPKFLMRLQAIEKVARNMGDDISRRQRRIAEVSRAGGKAGNLAG